MKYVIVITGASSGMGQLTAHALAKAGHTVYATMRDTAGRNKPQVEAAAKFSADHKVDLRTIELDVLNQESVDTAIQKIIADNGRIDVSFTMLDIWHLGLPRRFFRNSSQNSTT